MTLRTSERRMRPGEERPRLGVRERRHEKGLRGMARQARRSQLALVHIDVTRLTRQRQAPEVRVHARRGLVTVAAPKARMLVRKHEAGLRMVEPPIRKSRHGVARDAVLTKRRLVRIGMAGGAGGKRHLHLPRRFHMAFHARHRRVPARERKRRPCVIDLGRLPRRFRVT